MEVNDGFMIDYKYSFLPINVGAPRFATSKNCKHLIVINTVVFCITG